MYPHFACWIRLGLWSRTCPEPGLSLNNLLPPRAAHLPPLIDWTLGAYYITVNNISQLRLVKKVAGNWGIVLKR